MGTTTTNFDFYKPSIGESGYGPAVSDTFDTLDTLFSKIAVVDGVRFTTIDAAVTGLGAGPGLVIIPADYAGAESANLSFNAVDGATYNLYRGQDNITVLDLRALTNKAYHINYGGQVLGSLSRLAVTQSKTSPSTTTSAILGTNQVTGTLPASTMAGITAEVDTEGTVTPNANGGVAAIEGIVAVRSNGGTIPNVFGVQASASMDRAGTTTNVTNMIAVRADVAENISAGAITNAIGLWAAAQTAGTARDYGVYAVQGTTGTNFGCILLGYNSGTSIDAEDSGGVPRRMVYGNTNDDVCIQMLSASKSVLIRAVDASNRLAVSSSGIVGSRAYSGPVTTLTYGASIAIDASAGNIAVVTVTDGAAHSFAAPTNPVTGQMLTITERNTFGAIATATWSASFKMGAAWTAPANGFSRSVTFYYNGSVWVECARTAADVSN